jgi:O-antigen chain-terminating methyltransferase
MASTPEPKISVDELMARVRATLNARDAELSSGPANSSPVVLAPTFHHSQLLLEQAQRVADVGSRIPPFGGLSRLLRPVARFTTRIMYFLLQVITVDQRVFNRLLFNVVQMSIGGIAQGESMLNRRLVSLEGDLTSLRQTLAQLRAEAADLHGRVSRSEQTLGQLRDETADLHGRMSRSEQALDQRRDETADLHGRVSDSEQTLGQLRGATSDLHGRMSRSERECSEAYKRAAALQASVAQQERRFAELSEAARAGMTERAVVTENTRRLTSERDHLFDALYVALEEDFRGSFEEITERLRIYLPDIRKVEAGTKDCPVLDLACGRGEWLALLRDEALHGRGIDANRGQIERCRGLGLEVVEGDVLTTLRGVPDGSVGAVTAFHLIEHLPFDSLIELLDHAVRVLVSGGVGIFETPNPDNVLVGANHFYLDPTHQRPLPSPLMKFLVEARGLHNVEIRPLHPYPDQFKLQGSEVAERCNRFFYGPQDYAILAFKA